MWTTELENLATLCFKALEGSNYGVRVAVAKLLGTVMATALMPKQAAGRSNVPSQKPILRSSFFIMEASVAALQDCEDLDFGLCCDWHRNECFMESSLFSLTQT